MLDIIEPINIFSGLILLAVFIVGTYLDNFFRKKRGLTDKKASVLVSYYTEGKDIVNLGDGKINRLYFSSYLIDNAKILLYKIDLPYSSKLHLLSVPRLKPGVSLDPSIGKTIMSRVDLEGDYSTYFSLFAEKDKQMEARYVLDPAAMAFTIDFCKTYNWELIDNTLYLLQDTSLKSDDPTILYDDIQRFVDEIKPAVELPLTKKQAFLATPYGKDRRENIRCPRCSGLLVYDRNYFYCPKGDGILINGRYLSELAKGKQKVENKFNDKSSVGQKIIKCPSCNRAMQKVAYNSGKEIIDSCISCSYRWLDGSEVLKIKNSQL